MRVLGAKRVEKVPLSGGGSVQVRRLGWREARRIYRDARDPETGAVDRDAATESLLRESIVGCDGIEMAFPDDLPSLIEELSPAEVNALERAALSDYHAAGDALGNSSTSSGG